MYNANPPNAMARAGHGNDIRGNGNSNPRAERQQPLENLGKTCIHIGYYRISFPKLENDTLFEFDTIHFVTLLRGARSQHHRIWSPNYEMAKLCMCTLAGAISM
jgi:hypothetical protein